MKLKIIFVISTLIFISPSGFAAKANQNVNSSSLKLEWFELEICPEKFRFAIVPDQAILLTKKGDDKTRDGLWLVDRADSMANTIIESLDSTIRSNHIIENK